MAPVDDETYSVIISEFHKDKESVDRLRKEQTRREIHDTRILNQQKEHKKLKLLSLEEQRKLEKKEMKKDIGLDVQNTINNDNDKKMNLENSKNKVDFASLELASKEVSSKKDFKKKDKQPKKKLRRIDLSQIESQVVANQNKKLSSDKNIDNKRIKTAEETVKKITAKIETKSKKKVYKKEKKINEDNISSDLKSLKIAEFSSVDELSKIFEAMPNEIIQKCMTLGVLATINQRLDWEIIELLAEEFGYVAEKLEDVGEELFTLGS